MKLALDMAEECKLLPAFFMANSPILADLRREGFWHRYYLGQMKVIGRLIGMESSIVIEEMASLTDNRVRNGTKCLFDD